MHTHRGFFMPIFRRHTMDKHSGSNSGIGFCSLLALLFIALKLTGFIHWSWLWVLSPIWINLAIWVVLVLIITAINR